MHLVLGSVATLAVATIYCLWRFDYFRRARTLRERVAYMLWVMAEGAP